MEISGPGSTAIPAAESSKKPARRWPLSRTATVVFAVFFSWLFLTEPIKKLISPTRLAHNWLEGEWVGNLEVCPHNAHDSRSPVCSGPARTAAIRVNLGVDDLFFMTYAGPGQIVFAGDPTRHYVRLSSIEFPDLYLNGKQVSRRYGRFSKACLDVGASAAPTGGKEEDVVCSPGSFYSGTITLEPKPDSSDHEVYGGVLHRGSDADYDALVRGLPVK